MTNGQGYLLTKDSMDYFHDHYIDDPRHDLDWRASPLLHPDLSAPGNGLSLKRPDAERFAL